MAELGSRSGRRWQLVDVMTLTQIPPLTGSRGPAELPQRFGPQLLVSLLKARLCACTETVVINAVLPFKSLVSRYLLDRSIISDMANLKCIFTPDWMNSHFAIKFWMEWTWKNFAPPPPPPSCCALCYFRQPDRNGMHLWWSRQRSARSLHFCTQLDPRSHGQISLEFPSMKALRWGPSARPTATCLCACGTCLRSTVQFFSCNEADMLSFHP